MCACARLATKAASMDPLAKAQPELPPRGPDAVVANELERRSSRPERRRHRRRALDSARGRSLPRDLAGMRRCRPPSDRTASPCACESADPGHGRPRREHRVKVRRADTAESVLKLRRRHSEALRAVLKTAEASADDARKVRAHTDMALRARGGDSGCGMSADVWRRASRSSRPRRRAAWARPVWPEW